MSQTKFQAASGNADRAIRSASEAAYNAGAAMRDASEQVLHNAADAGEKLRGRADDAMQDLGKQIENQPITSVLIAAGVGLLAGLMLGRR
jgi:ElaB/YqjD/DUF883 family membrane-anchored ribosome-binding protein